MDKVAVRKAVRAEFPLSGGPPIMMVGGGGRGGRGPVGVTRGQRALGALGGLVGVAGALTGQHRSLGGLVQSAVSGGATGSQLGRGIGRALTTRTGQARADLREQAKQARAMERASVAEQLRERGEGPLSRFNPMAAVRRRNTAVADRHEQELDRVNRANRAMQVAVQQSGQEYGRQGRQARRVAEAEQRGAAEARGADFGAEDARYAQVGRNISDMMGGMRLEDMEQRVTQARAAGEGGRVRVEPVVGEAEFEERPQTNVDAAGRPVQVIGPGTPMNALPAPSNPQDTAAGENSRMDKLGNDALRAQGTDTTREETVSGGGMSPEQESAMRAQMQGGQVLVRDAQERADEEEKKQRFPQQSLPNSSSVQGE